MQTILVEARNAPEQDEAFVSHLQAWEVEWFDRPVYAYYAILNRRRRTYRFIACFDPGEVIAFQKAKEKFRLAKHKPSLWRLLCLNLGMRATLCFPDHSPSGITARSPSVLFIDRRQ